MVSIELSKENFISSIGEYVSETKNKFSIPDAINVSLAPRRPLSQRDIDLVKKFLNSISIQKKLDIAHLINKTYFNEHISVTLPEDKFMSVNWGVSVTKITGLSSFTTTFISGVSHHNNIQHPYYESVVVFSPYSFYSPLSKIPLKRKYIEFFINSIDSQPSSLVKKNSTAIKNIITAFIDNMLLPVLRIVQDKGVIEFELFGRNKLYYSESMSEEEFENCECEKIISLLDELKML